MRHIVASMKIASLQGERLRATSERWQGPAP